MNFKLRWRRGKIGIKLERRFRCNWLSIEYKVYDNIKILKYLTQSFKINIIVLKLTFEKYIINVK